MKELTRASVLAPNDQPIPAMVDAAPSPALQALRALTANHNLRAITAAGPNAAALTEAILIDGNTLIVPPGQDPADTYTQARAALPDRPPGVNAPCPDGRAWCTGDPAFHADPREHIHHSPQRSLTGPYGTELLGFHLTQWNDDQPVLTFEAGGEWRDLDLAGVDRLYAELMEHCGGIWADREQLAALIAARHTSGNAEAIHTPAPAARTWTLSLSGGGEITGPLPDWAEEDPSEGDLTPDQLRLRLVDMNHRRAFDGAPLDVHVPGSCTEDGKRGVYEESVLSGSIDLAPYSEGPARHEPTVTLQLVEEFLLEDLDPDGLADVITKLRAQLGRLDQVHADLVQARAEWEAAQ